MSSQANKPILERKVASYVSCGCPLRDCKCSTDSFWRPRLHRQIALNVQCVSCGKNTSNDCGWCHRSNACVPEKHLCNGRQKVTVQN